MLTAQGASPAPGTAPTAIDSEKLTRDRMLGAAQRDDSRDELSKRTFAPLCVLSLLLPACLAARVFFSLVLSRSVAG